MVVADVACAQDNRCSDGARTVLWRSRRWRRGGTVSVAEFRLEGQLARWDRRELKLAIRESDLDVRVLKSMSVDALREAIFRAARRRWKGEREQACVERQLAILDEALSEGDIDVDVESRARRRRKVPA
jgi:hypothetical protein